jgi:hypothetical protein
MGWNLLAAEEGGGHVGLFHALPGIAAMVEAIATRPPGLPFPPVPVDQDWLVIFPAEIT